MQKIQQLFIMIVLLLGIGLVPAQAGDVILSNNAGDGNSSWFIEGEPSLIMNGFDLTGLSLTAPILIDAVSISVETPVPDTAIDVIIYEDADGGSPINATVAGRTQTVINSAGVARIVFDPAVTINQPVVWVGFYVPVGFHFYADTSGSSVLTYWAWSPGTTFDVTNLSSAAVLGPADGTAPVNINLGGVARITGEIRTASSSSQTIDNAVIGQQIVETNPVDLSPMQPYSYCELLRYDKEDVLISALDGFDLYCRVHYEPDAPVGIAPSLEFERRGILFDISAYGNYRKAANNAEELVVPVTHCLAPDLADLDRAVLGVAYGSPRSWHILPTVRFGEVICAEVTHIGNISYFVPRTGSEPYLNTNLVFGQDPVISPHPLICKRDSLITVSVRNNGSVSTGSSSVIRIEDVLVRTGELVWSSEFWMPELRPGETHDLTVSMNILSYYNEAHRTVVILDSKGEVSEFNENDNRWSQQYILSRGKC